MQLGFTHLAGFTREWRRSGLSDDDLQELEGLLLENPEAGAVMQGTGGMRKVRFAPPGRGKSGAFRVGYAYYRIGDMILLVTVFAKNAKENLSAAEKAQIKQIINAFKP